MNATKFNANLLEKLYEPLKNCQACPLSKTRTNIVFGTGNPNATLMIVGEGPGRDEDLQGIPFVGKSGQLLTKALEAYGITREEIFIANIVKCRPPNNRAPIWTESQTCMSLLLYNQIKIIRPKIICALGSSALNMLLSDQKNPLKITKVRGQVLKKGDLLIFPTFHPAYILR